MESLTPAELPRGALILLDSSPIIYLLEGTQGFADRYRPWFDAHSKGQIHFAVSTITIAEVLAGPLQSGAEILAARYRSILESWRVVNLDTEIATDAARLRARFRLRLPDAVQAASALAVKAAALVTHDRDFSRVRGLLVIS